MKNKRYSLLLLILIFITFFTACVKVEETVQDTDTDTTPTPLEHNLPIVGIEDFPIPIAVITDPDGSTFANEARVTSGDDFNRGLYERPFSAEGMLYQSDLDIQQATIASDEHFYYFTLTLKGVSESTNTLTGTYGIEFDRTKTGRGDLLITVQNVTENWSQQNIQVFIDPDKDIGGPTPILADEGFTGDGYESLVKLEDNKVAFVSLLPGYPNIIQLTVSRDLLEGVDEFLWGAWADKGVDDPGAFDYNDRYSAEQAGSPIKDNANYPLAALFNVDNTCRQPFGFSPDESIPGTCLMVPPTESKGSSFCCPQSGCCSFPQSCCGEGPDPTPTPTAKPDDFGDDPADCEPRTIVHLSSSECSPELESRIGCDGDNHLITIVNASESFTPTNASSPGFTCTVAAGVITCTGPKQEGGTPITVEVCGKAVPVKVPNCKDYPNSFWDPDLGACIQLGSSCCPIGQEWLPDEGRCIPIVAGNGQTNQGGCGDGYVQVNGSCIYKGSLDSCCTTIELTAPCCFTSCVSGYILDYATGCCYKDPDPCSGINCSDYGRANCPTNCCVFSPSSAKCVSK